KTRTLRASDETTRYCTVSQLALVRSGVLIMRRLSSRSRSLLRRCPCSVKQCVMATVVLFATVPDMPAVNIRWSGQGGNTLFHTLGNWTSGQIPGVIDVAQ